MDEELPPPYQPPIDDDLTKAQNGEMLVMSDVNVTMEINSAVILDQNGSLISAGVRHDEELPPPYQPPIDDLTKAQNGEMLVMSDVNVTMEINPAVILDQNGSLISAGVRQIPGFLSWECYFPTRSGRVEFQDTLGNKMFILEPRPTEMILYMGSSINQQPGPQEWCYLPVSGHSFRAFISVVGEGFAIDFDGVRHKLYHHRVPFSTFSGVVTFIPSSRYDHPPQPETSECCAMS